MSDTAVDEVGQAIATLSNSCTRFRIDSEYGRTEVECDGIHGRDGFVVRRGNLRSALAAAVSYLAIEEAKLSEAAAMLRVQRLPRGTVGQ